MSRLRFYTSWHFQGNGHIKYIYYICISFKYICFYEKYKLSYAGLFWNTFRSIDDLITINDGKLFGKSHTEIYTS